VNSILRGYGMKKQRLYIDIVHNLWALIFRDLRRRWNTSNHERLLTEHGFISIKLFCITNLPVDAILIISSNPEILKYLSALCHSYNPAAVKM